jgi:hypothetical protein
MKLKSSDNYGNSIYPAHGISVYRDHGKTVYHDPRNSAYRFQELVLESAFLELVELGYAKFGHVFIP